MRGRLRLAKLVRRILDDRWPLWHRLRELSCRIRGIGDTLEERVGYAEKRVEGGNESQGWFGGEVGRLVPTLALFVCFCSEEDAVAGLLTTCERRGAPSEHDH